MSNQTRDGKYDVFLAVPFEREGSDDLLSRTQSRFPLYDAIGKMIEGVGRSIYLPHQQVQRRWTPSETVVNIKQAMLNSDLALVYLGIESSDVGVMIGEAVKQILPMIHFYEKGTQIDPRIPRAGPGPVRGEVEYSSKEDAIRKLRESVVEFFQESQTNILQRRSIINRLTEAGIDPSITLGEAVTRGVDLTKL